MNDAEKYALVVRKWTIHQLGNDDWALLIFESLIITVLSFIALYSGLSSARAVFGSLSSIVEVVQHIIEAVQRTGTRLLKAVIFAFISYLSFSIALNARDRLPDENQEHIQTWWDGIRDVKNYFY